MSRVLSIDYGKKRTGLAVTDPLQIIATALDTIETKVIMPYLKDYIQKQDVTQLVVGIAKDLKGQDTHSTESILLFIKQLELTFPHIPIAKIDERFTSKMAFDTMLLSGIGKMKRRDKGTVDRISAVIILQSFLEQRRNLQL